EIYREQGDLALATKHLARSRELGELAGLPEMKYRWFTAMAGVKQAQEDFREALELLLQAERLYGGGFSPDVRPISAMRARVWIKQGRLDEAFAWARDSGLTADDELSYLREFEHVTLARLLLARGEHDPAMKLLTRLLVAAEAGGRIGA